MSVSTAKESITVYANGGHNPPRRLAADGSVSAVPVKTNVVVGVMEGKSFALETLVLRPGEALFLYTDGVTEAIDDAHALYGEERMDRRLSSSPPGASAAELLRSIAADVAAFSGSQDQADDITMLALRYEGPPAP